ncbi:4-alpha-glucanotransferase [Clostridiaceae bacterium OttesenSCG-928-D20]|nr:4-alpha-glucanotransferase [Clostridiaceae bacterium OttesenSCG-928-D20]
MDRSYGILMPLSALPGEFGIGTMGEKARDFIDGLKGSGAKWWQLLPLTQPGAGDSPYQSVSAFAGSYFYIDYKELFQEGLLTREQLQNCENTFPNTGEVDYTKQTEKKLELLYPIYNSMDDKLRSEVKVFGERHEWAESYCKFMERALGLEAEFFMLLQYLFSKQWNSLREYANKSGISLIGDMPIYVAPEGVEISYHPEFFDKNGAVAGVPPDAFSEEGQHWGNPLYDWQAMKNDGYGWWIRRFDHEMSRFDLVRVDHFRGFEAYWEIPAGAKSAKEGKWVKGPGRELFDTLKSWFGGLSIIAEDLGMLTPSFYEFMGQCGFPGLKVLQFAFEPGQNSSYLPHNSIYNSIVYTGTHDNDTTLGWWQKLSAQKKAFVSEYLGAELNDDNICDNMIKAAMRCVSRLCIIPMQDVLSLPTEARINTPGTAMGNWKWRMEKGQFTPERQEELRKMAGIYAR